MENYTRLADTVASSGGKVYVTINGSRRELFELSKISAQIDQIVQAKRMLGHKMTQHKPIGAEGTGSLTMYFMNSEMLNQTVDFLKKGKAQELTLQCYNEDEQSTVGRQEVMLTNVILASIPVAILDDDSDDPITFDTDFTFDDLEVLSSFVKPQNYR